MMKQELISGQASSAVLWDFKNCTIFLHWPYEPPRMAVLSSSNSLVVTPINLLLCVEYSAPSHLVFLKESIPYWVTFAVWEFISIHHPLEEREARLGNVRLRGMSVEGPIGISESIPPCCYTTAVSYSLTGFPTSTFFEGWLALSNEG